MRKSQMPFKHMPWRLVPWIVKFINWIQIDWNINLSIFGIPKDPFGSIMVTSIGTLGMEMVFVPLTHIGRTPAQIAVGKIYKKPVVIDDQIAIRSRLNLCCTFDHRFMDGILASRMAAYITDTFENVLKYRDILEENLLAESKESELPKEPQNDNSKTDRKSVV